VTNQSKDYNYSISTQLHRRFSDRLEATVAYTYLKSMDVQSLTSDRAISNSAMDGSSRSRTATSRRPRRCSPAAPLLAYGTYSLPSRTDITLYYEGTSGVPFVYVTNATSTATSSTATTRFTCRGTPPTATRSDRHRDGQRVRAERERARAFENFIKSRRVSTASAGDHGAEQLPLAFPEPLGSVDSSGHPIDPGQALSLQLDVFNFLNLPRPALGPDQAADTQCDIQHQSALSQTGRNPGPLSQSIPTFTFDTRLYDATTLNPKPFASRATLSSNYQVQLTLRYSF